MDFRCPAHAASAKTAARVDDSARRTRKPGGEMSDRSTAAFDQHPKKPRRVACGLGRNLRSSPADSTPKFPCLLIKGRARMRLRFGYASGLRNSRWPTDANAARSVDSPAGHRTARGPKPSSASRTNRGRVEKAAVAFPVCSDRSGPVKSSPNRRKSPTSARTPFDCAVFACLRDVWPPEAAR